MSSLPPGVTDEMCEGPIVECANCGHTAGAHYDKAKIEHTKDGDVIHACDVIVGKFHDERGDIQCDCELFTEGEYEPEYDKDD